MRDLHTFVMPTISAPSTCSDANDPGLWSYWIEPINALSQDKMTINVDMDQSAMVLNPILGQRHADIDLNVHFTLPNGSTTSVFF